MEPIDYLNLAVEESRLSVSDGSSPFGAVIVKEDVILARAHNQVIELCDPTAHAEVLCIRKACEKIKSHDLKGCVLYTSCEPCPMCLNAAKWANIEAIYYAVTRADADSIGFRDKIFYEETPLKMKRIPLSSAREVMDDWFQKKEKKLY